MALHLLRNLSKPSALRGQQKSFKLQKRDNGTSTQPPNQPKISPSQNQQTNNQQPQQSNAGLALAVGVSLGLGLGAATQHSWVKQYFNMNEGMKVPEKPMQPQLDPVLTQELLNVTRRVGQMENHLHILTNELKEKDQIIAQQMQRQTPTTNNNVFELSKVIEANDLASANKHRRELDEQNKALTREYMLRIEGEVLKVENKYRPIVNNVKKLEAHLQSLEELRRHEEPARLMWLTCQSLLEKLRFSPMEPLEKNPDYEMLKKFAAESDPVAIKVLDSLPAKALKEGVCSEEMLIDRYFKLESICKRVAMVGEHGGGLGKYLVSYLQSLFIFDNVRPSEDELSGKSLVDPTSWQTYDILGRVRWCLKQHNIEQAIRYANQLKGQARLVARDWIRDARLHLETKQAIDILSTYAKSVSVKVSRESSVNE